MRCTDNSEKYSITDENKNFSSEFDRLLDDFYGKYPRVSELSGGIEFRGDAPRKRRLRGKRKGAAGAGKIKLQ